MSEISDSSGARYDQDGKIIDQRCPTCGAWASEHHLQLDGFVIGRSPKSTLELTGEFPDWKWLKCPGERGPRLGPSDRL